VVRHRSAVGLFGNRVAPTADAAAAAQVGKRFDPGTCVCEGFEHHVRITHWVAGEEERWDAPPEVIATVARIGADHTSTPAEATFAIWDGHGWASRVSDYYWVNSLRAPRTAVERLRLAAMLRYASALEHRHQRRVQRWLDGRLSDVPRLELPFRTYLLLRGPVSAAAQLTEPVVVDTLRLVPDLWWPADEAWFVATDVELDATVVSGSGELARALVEAFPDRTSAG
jgi:hypothetical protein